MFVKRLNKGVWAGILIFLFALIFLILSFQFPYSGRLGPGPGFFPLWISMILLILSLLYIYVSFKAQTEDGEQMPKGKSLANILFILFCMVIYISLISILGFVLTSMLFLLALLYREFKWYYSILLSLGISILLFWLFGSILHVPLPVNGLGW